MPVYSTASPDDGGALVEVEVNGVRVHCADEGQGPWLVLSHSLGCSLGMWEAQLAEFRRDYRLLAFDTRGHGRSSAPAGRYTLDMLADDLEALLDCLGVTRCHFMGLSMGGMIGMAHAMRYPGRFDSLVLCDTSSRLGPEAAPVWADRIETATRYGMGPLVEPTLRRWFTVEFLARQHEVVERVGEMIRSTPVEGYVGCCHAISGIDVTERLGALRIPTLVVCGDQDAGTPVEMARAIQQAIPAAQLAVIPSASHLSNVEQPEVFNLLVRRFLAGVAAASR